MSKLKNKQKKSKNSTTKTIKQQNPYPNLLLNHDFDINNIFINHQFIMMLYQSNFDSIFDKFW